jgi:hypothetical protein
MVGKLGLVMAIGLLGCGGRVALGDNDESEDTSLGADGSASRDTAVVSPDGSVGPLSDAPASFPDAGEALGRTCFSFPYEAKRDPSCSGVGLHPPDETGPGGCSYASSCPDHKWQIDCTGDGECTCTLDGKKICTCTMPLPLPFFCNPFDPSASPDGDTRPVCCFPSDGG